MQVNIYVHKNNVITKLSIEDGEKVLPLLREHNLMTFPCGIGKCGKCKIYAKTIPSDEDVELLSACLLESGMRLACHTRAKEGLQITIPKEYNLRVLTNIVKRPYPYLPIVREKVFTITPPDVEDQRSDIKRILDGCQCTKHTLGLDRLGALPRFIRENELCYAIVQGKTLLNYSSTSIYYALSIDIGTTSISAHLTDLCDKEIVAEHGEPNAQAAYGADIISRIQFDMEWRAKEYDGNSPLQHLIIEQINKIIKSFLLKLAIHDVSAISIAGNTTMMHLLCGLPTENIGRAPFTPVALLDPGTTAKELGLCSDAPVFLLPGISSYVGADIIAAMLAAEAWKQTEPFLLLDIGTNAETILGVNGKFYACSAAAGPCFEGVTIDCGMPGQEGAIDSVIYDAHKGLSYSTIAKAPALGLCGSGVLSATALLLEHQLLDSSGYIEKKDTVLGHRIKNDALFITDSIYLSQKDIREIQMAKAAVRAGIDVLLLRAGLEEKDIKRLFLAGGFGTALPPKDAVRIGLFPEHLEEKVTVLGNAASMGALRYITEKNARKHAMEMRENTQYIELSCDGNFTNTYIDRMFFPEMP